MKCTLYFCGTSAIDTGYINISPTLRMDESTLPSGPVIVCVDGSQNAEYAVKCKII